MSPGAERPRPLREVAASLGLGPEEVLPYGHDAAKLPLEVLARPRRREGPARLVLVSAITPTPAGEGKTTIGIGLAQALARLGEPVCLALREPSLGPVLGRKGGSIGGGRSRLVPAERICLHFTGDFHAVGAAHNLLAAVLDNHLHRESPLDLDPRRILWPRVIDLDDRALRRIVIGLGGPDDGVPRESGFEITAASEVMTMLSLAEGPEDLRARLARALVGFSRSGHPVCAGALGVTGAQLALLGEALLPNLVQTGEGTPALVHGGAFADVGHGCCSVLATRMALHLADWVVTEAGFGFELGAEKFFDITCESAGLEAAAVVLVATLRALRARGGARGEARTRPAPAAVERGLANLERHLASLRAFGASPVVALNRSAGDGDAEIGLVRARCRRLGVPFAVADAYARGGEGALGLARLVRAHAAKGSLPVRPLYAAEDPVEAKIGAVARTAYGAGEVRFTEQARRDLAEIRRLGYARLPVCMAKPPRALFDASGPAGGAAEGERAAQPAAITVREVRIQAGAGLLLASVGAVRRMPGLPHRPRAEGIDLCEGRVRGLEA